MVTVSSAFMSSRRERIIFSVLSASLCAFKAAARVDVLRVFGKTDLDNTGVARDHFLSLYRKARILGPCPPYYACGVNGFNILVTTTRHSRVLLIYPPAPVRVPKSGRGEIEFHSGEKDPGGRALIRQARRLILGQSVARQRLRCRACERAKTLWRTVDHGNRHLGGDAPPVLPAMELREIVCAHDPYEAHTRDAAAQMRDRVDSVARSDDRFETRDVDARILGDVARRTRALGQSMQSVVILQRIAGTEQPPHAVQLEALQREQTDGTMRRMRRIEGAAKQADAHAVGVERDGRSC